MLSINSQQKYVDNEEKKKIVSQPSETHSENENENTTEIHPILYDIYYIMNLFNIYEFSFLSSNFDNQNISCMIPILMNNPSCNIIIIESMCLGIILPDYFAYKFKYIQNLHIHNTPVKHPQFNIKIININSCWDTSKWSYQNLSKFTFRLPDYENCSIDQIKNFEPWKKALIDIHFLEALSWQP